MNVRPFATAFALVLGLTGAARADQRAPAPKSKDAAQRAVEKSADAGERKGELAGVAAPVLPLGNASDAVGFGLGATLDASWLVAPNVSLVGRAGYVHHLPKSGMNMTLGVLPVWVGARYHFVGREGAYLEGTVGPSILFASAETPAGSVSDDELKLGFAAGGGYRFKIVDVGARALAYDVGHAGDSFGLMATVGFPFLAF